MQAEAIGQLNLDTEMVHRLGIHNLSQAKCQVATASWMTTPVVETEQAMICLRIPIVQCSKVVIPISTSPPYLRTRRVVQGNIICLSPVDWYMSRPASMEKLTIMYRREILIMPDSIRRK